MALAALSHAGRAHDRQPRAVAWLAGDELSPSPAGWLRRRPLSAAVLYSVVASFPLFFAGGYAIRIQADLALSTSRFGWAVSAYFLASTLASFTIGGWIDRRGARLGFVAAGLGGAAASVMVALAGSFWPLAIAFGVAGLGNTAGQLASNLALIEVPARRQGLAFGVKQAAVPLGSFLAGTIVGAFGDGIDWRRAFATYAAVALVVAGVAAAAGRETAVPGHGGSPGPRSAVGADWPFLLALSVAGAFGGAMGNGLAVLVVDAFDAAGYGEAAGATALATGSAITIAARIGIGWLAGRRGGDGFIELGAAMALGTVGFGLLVASGSSAVLLWVGVLMAFLAAWGWPGVMYYAVVRRASTAAGTATGVVVTGVFLGGIAGTPLLAGIADRWSYTTAWAVAAGMSVAAAVLVAVARMLAERRPSGVATVGLRPSPTDGRHPG